MNEFQDKICDDVMAVQILLDDWNLPELKQVFADEEISIRTLDCIEEDDKQLREIIPKFGTRKIFLSYLKKWKDARKNKGKDCQQINNITSNSSNITKMSSNNTTIPNSIVSNGQQNLHSNTLPLQHQQNDQSTSKNLSQTLPTKIIPNSIPIEQQELKVENIFQISQPYTLTENNSTESKPKITHQPKSIADEKNKTKIPKLKINVRKFKKQTKKIQKLKAVKQKHRERKPLNSPKLPKLNYKEYNGEELNIIELLMQKEDLYKNIFSYYEENNALNEKFRRELIYVLNLAVFERRIQKGPELHKIFNNFADQIIQCFPTEQRDIYCDPKTFTGKLCNKYHNFLHDLKVALMHD